MKSEIRTVYNMGNHSVHIHDTYDEGLRIAKTLLNQNSIDLLNRNIKLSESNKKLFKLFYDMVSTNGNRDDVCIDSSFVLALHGLREARDLDYLSLKNNILFNNSDINCHNSEARHYTVDKDTIILNPEYHFYYGGIKFASLDIVKKMKMKRNELKDQNDVRLINKYISCI